MKYITILLFTIFIIFVLFYPFKVTLYNKDNYLYIDINNFLLLNLNLFVLLDDDHKEDLKKQAKGLSVIKKVKFKEIEVKVNGLNFDYRLNGAYFGAIYAISGFIHNLCRENNINFNYEYNYLGDKSIEFKSVFRARISSVILGFYGI